MLKTNYLPNSNNTQDIRILSKKDYFLMKLLGVLFPRFYNWVPTTFGNRLYLPAKWDMFPQSVQSVIIEHEKIHSAQQKKITPLLYHFLNLFVLPILFNPFRLYWEKDAWEKTIYLIARNYSTDFLNNKGFLWFISQVNLFYTINGGWIWLNKTSVHNWLDYVVSTNFEREKRLSQLPNTLG